MVVAYTTTLTHVVRFVAAKKVREEITVKNHDGHRRYAYGKMPNTKTLHVNVIVRLRAQLIKFVQRNRPHIRIKI